MAAFIIERGPDAGKRIPLASFPVIIGRDPESTVIINDEEVSRTHFRIKKRGRLYIVEDLESRNGTYINGDRVLNSIVQNGDKILVGSTELLFASSEPEIQLATEIFDFDMVVAEQLGISGPIDVGSGKERKKFTPIRLNRYSIANQTAFDTRTLKQIFDLENNIVVIDDLDEASKTLLKSIGHLLPSASRAAFFIWLPTNRQLIPYATRLFQKEKIPFLLSQRAMEDVLARRQGVLLQAESPQVTYSGRDRIILPMLHHEEPICLIHIEFDQLKRTFSNAELELVQAFIDRCAPSFDAMLLKRELDSWMVGMIETMIATLEAKDTYTHGHSERVSRYAMAIADELKLNREVKRLLLVSSLCHDIGKIGVPDAILKKASLLSAEEYEEMKLHPTIGAEIVSHMPNAHRFISGVKHHHEKWNGTGYPDGLVGEEIPFFGRIVGIADSFDAMVSGRSYSGFLDQSDAVERLMKEGGQFDPDILKAFIKAHENGTLTLKTSTQNQELPENAKSVEKAPATHSPASLKISHLKKSKK